MLHRPHPGWIARAARIGVIALSLVATAAAAAPMPNSARKVSMTAREQPIGPFLQTLLAQADIPVVVSPSLTGAVNGTFSGAAGTVLQDIARAYTLVTYFDGAVMHVVPASEIGRHMFPASPTVADRVLREAEEIGLVDSRNTLRRTNDGNLVAIGVPRFIAQVEELIRNKANPLPQAPGSTDFRIFYLRYARAHDATVMHNGRPVVLPGVASILRSLVGQRPNATPTPEVMLRPTVPPLRGQGLGQGMPHRIDDRERGNNAVEALVTALGRTAQAPQPEQPQPAILQTAPRQVRIEAEPRLNAVIVYDLADRLARYEQLIAALDVAPQSLEIEATIIDVNTDRVRELGIDWRFSNGKSAFQVTNGAAIPPIGGGTVEAIIGGIHQFLARVRALQSEGAARIVSSPQVAALSNMEAVLKNASTMHVRVAGRNEVDLFPITVGTVLRVTPAVSRDQGRTQISMAVHIEDGALSDRQVDNIPIVANSEINTQAVIEEGQSLLLGGMVRESSSMGEDKVPLLGDVPVLGHLFKNQKQGASRIERMFLITPRLAGTRPATPTTSVQAPAQSAPVGPAPRQSKVVDLEAMDATPQTTRLAEKK